MLPSDTNLTQLGFDLKATGNQVANGADSSESLLYHYRNAPPH